MQVMDKNCEKIHYIAPNIYCCGAGTAADTENTTGALISARFFVCYRYYVHVVNRLRDRSSLVFL